MIYTEVNGTLADLLEVYRVKVSNLESGLESSEREISSAQSEAKRVKEHRDGLLQDLDRDRKLSQERETKNAELVEKVKKLKGVIESLHIELQNEREAHQTSKEN